MSRYKSRKFIISLFIIILTAILCWFGKIDKNHYRDIAIAVVGIYAAANVTQKKNAGGTNATVSS